MKRIKTFFFVMVNSDPLFTAVMQREITYVDQLIKLRPSSINQYESSGNYTPLAASIINKFPAATVLLLKHGADPNLPYDCKQKNEQSKLIIQHPIYDDNLSDACLLIFAGAIFDINQLRFPQANRNVTKNVLYAISQQKQHLNQLIREQKWDECSEFFTKIAGLESNLIYKDYYLEQAHTYSQNNASQYSTIPLLIASKEKQE